MVSLGDVLKKSAVFDTLAIADLDRLTPMFEKREFYTGETLSVEGDPAQFFFLLGQGTLVLALEEGKAVVLDAPGNFAAMELLSRQGVYTTTITALEDGVLWTIPRLDFLTFIQEDTEGAAAVMAGWQDFLDSRAAFAKLITDIDVPVMF